MSIFDREASINARPRDWTIVLHWALPTFKKLLPENVVANLDKAVCNPYLDFDEEAESLPCYNGVTGDLLFKSKLPGSRRVSRQRLRGVLAEGLDVQWGKKLEGISAEGDGPVRVAFEDGETVEVDYVLGTDGTASKVRELLFKGDEVANFKQSGFMIGTTIAKYGDAGKVEAVIKAHPVGAILMGTDAVGGQGSMSDPSSSVLCTREPN